MNEYQKELIRAIGELIDASMLSGHFTGEQIADVLEYKLESVKRTNKIVLALGDALTKKTGIAAFSEEAAQVVIGKSGGQA